MASTVAAAKATRRHAPRPRWVMTTRKSGGSDFGFGFLFVLHEPLVQDLMISILVQPDGIGVLPDEFIRIHAVDGGPHAA